MAIGDQVDMLGRIKSTLVKRWFASTAPASPTSTPVLDGTLSGPAWMWSWLWSLLQYVADQRRIGTAQGSNLDLIANDFFGLKLSRFSGEGDDLYRRRIKANLLAPKNTRAAMIAAISSLTGEPPVIFEPRNATDTGGYGSIGMTAGTGFAYASADGTVQGAGGYGNLNLQFQAFIHAYRPHGGGVSNSQGYSQLGGTGTAVGGYGYGAIQYATMDMVANSITDADIDAAIVATAPAATIMWTVITSAPAGDVVTNVPSTAALLGVNFILGVSRMTKSS